MIVGNYTLHLYCDNEGNKIHAYSEFPHEYTDELGSVCRRMARRDGWTLGERTLCPKCSKKKRKEQ